MPNDMDTGLVQGLREIRTVLDDQGRAFEEYKSVNDQRLAEIAARGKADPLLDEKLARMDRALDDLAEVRRRMEQVELRAARPGGEGAAGSEGPIREEREYRAAFGAWLRRPSSPELQARMAQASSALQSAARAQGLEARAAQVATLTGAAGGFAVPAELETAIARLTRDISPMRQVATVRTVSTPDYKELFAIGGAGFEWIGETGTRAQTTTPDLAEIAPTFGMISARPRASEESLDDMFFNVEAWLQTEVAESFARGEGIAFITGTGTNQPTGFLAGPAPVTTADATRPFGTLQYIPGGQGAAMPTNMDPLVDMTYALRARYRANAVWMAQKAVFAVLRKYKDTTGQYLWQPAIAAGQPDSFMGYRVVEAEDMPAVAANAFPLAFGDFGEGYLIADRVGLRVTRDELTVPGFVSWYVRRRTGGRLRNSEAIKVLRIATS